MVKDASTVVRVYIEKQWKSHTVEWKNVNVSNGLGKICKVSRWGFKSINSFDFSIMFLELCHVRRARNGQRCPSTVFTCTGKAEKKQCVNGPLDLRWLKRHPILVNEKINTHYLTISAKKQNNGKAAHQNAKMHSFWTTPERSGTHGFLMWKIQNLGFCYCPLTK